MTEQTTRERSAGEVMAILSGLDPGVSLKFSEWTGKWYVDARIEIGDGVILEGGADHRDTPEAAIQATFRRLTTVPLDKYVATKHRGQRREWRWNGAAFVEITRQAVDA